MTKIDAGPESLPVGEEAPPRSRTLADRVLGMVGGAMVLCAVALLFVGGPEDGAAAVDVDAPALEMVQPRHGADIRTERLVVVFRTEDLRLAPGGWGSGPLHLHLQLNGTEIMPAARDIETVSEGVYRWTLPLPEPGLHTLRLVWSGPDHQAIAGAGSRTIQVKVE